MKAAQNINELKFLRKERKLKLKEIEELTGIKTNTFSRYESGDRDLSTKTIRLLCEFFEVSSDFLLGISLENAYVNYKGHSYYISKDLLLEAKNKKCLAYVDNKRNILLNKFIGVKEDINLNKMIELMDTSLNKSIIEGDNNLPYKEIYKSELDIPKRLSIDLLNRIRLLLV